MRTRVEFGSDSDPSRRAPCAAARLRMQGCGLHPMSVPKVYTTPKSITLRGGVGSHRQRAVVVWEVSSSPNTFLNEGPVWSAASSNGNGDDGRIVLKNSLLRWV